MKRPWMPFYFDDFRFDTLDLDAAEVGTYFVMILLAWRRGDGSLPADMVRLKRMLQACISRFHGLTFNRIVPMLLDRYFYREGEFWFQKRVVSELRKARELSEKQARNVGKRWAKTRENNDLADTAVLPIQSQLQSQVREKKDLSFVKGKNLSLTRAVADATRTPIQEDFEKFWKSYPKRDGSNPKEPARKLFVAAVKAGTEPAQICGAVRRYASCEHDQIGTPFIAQAVTWLRQKRWQDYPVANSNGGWQPGMPTSEELRAKYERDRVEEAAPVDGSGLPARHQAR